MRQSDDVDREIVAKALVDISVDIGNILGRLQAVEARLVPLERRAQGGKWRPLVAKVLAVRCEDCGAEPGEWCRKMDDTKAPNLHAVREQAVGVRR